MASPSQSPWTVMSEVSLRSVMSEVSLRSVTYVRDPSPSLILPMSGDFHGKLWASGIFPGLQHFMQEEGVQLVINCLTHGDGHILAIEVEEGRIERTQHLLKLCVASLAQGQGVLVHCKHGIHRTGSFITLLVTMLLVMSMRCSMSMTDMMPSWESSFNVAWEFWAARRGLEERVNCRHDFYQESWTAFQEYYGQTPVKMLEEIYAPVAAAFLEACQRKRAAEKILQSIRRMLVPVELRAAPDVRGVGARHDTSRSPRRVQAKARPSRRLPQPTRPSTPPPSRDVPEVPVARSSSSGSRSWRAENVVEGEVSQMPWRPFLTGDWRCMRCGNHNMHWRGYCFGQHGRCRNPRDASFRPGDWYCQCGNYNLYWRTQCNRDKCGRSRTDGGEQNPPGPQLYRCSAMPVLFV